MAKVKSAPVAQAVAQATIQTPTLYVLGKQPRNGLHENTKHGSGGTAGTYSKLASALAKGPLTLAELQAIAADNNDKGFARYAIRNHWVVPAQA
jgi:hypothetical protein